MQTLIVDAKYSVEQSVKLCASYIIQFVCFFALSALSFGF